MRHQSTGKFIRLGILPLVTLLLAMTAQVASAATAINVVDSAGDVGHYASLALDGSGFPVIGYHNNTTGALLLAHCNDANCAGNDESIQTVDDEGSTGAFLSLALDSSGFPVISYSRLDTGDLKLVHCNDANCADNNEFIQTVDGTASNTGLYTSLALDGSGFPVISYYDVTTHALKVAHCNDANCAGNNESLETVDNTSGTGAFTSLALDGNGFPVISYQDIDHFYLRLAHCNDVNCAGGGESLQTVDSTGLVGFHTSLALNGIGFPVISYYDFGNQDLKLTYCGDANCTTNIITTVDNTGSVGSYTSLALNVNGFPVISYYDGSNGDLKLTHCNNASCTGNKTVQAIDSAGNVGRYTSLALDGSGFPVIAYLDNTNSDLKLAHCDIARCQSPDLTAVKTHTPSGDFTVGDSWDWTITIHNGGNKDAEVDDGTTILVDYLPTSGLTYGTVTTTGDATGPLACAFGAGSVLTCEADGAQVTIPQGGDLHITIPVTADTPGAYSNPRTGSDGPVCAVDPDDNVTEDDNTNNSCGPDSVTVTLPCVLANCSFEAPAGPNLLADGWKKGGVKTPGDGTDTAFFANGSQSFRFTNPKAKAKKLYQDVNMDILSVTPMDLKFWWRAQDVTGKKGLFRVMVILSYAPKGSQKFYINMPVGTTDWTEYTLEFVTAKTVKKVRVEIDFGKQGTAWFDNFRLSRP